MNSPLNTRNDPTVLLAELASFSPPPRSKLQPHRELIRELRRKGRTYRAVSRLSRTG
jgi:hypothetical protein